MLEERLAEFEYAVQNYDDGLLFFYFSSSDLQSHMFWWDSDDAHPLRSTSEAQHYFQHIQRLYQTLDKVVGDVYDRYGDRATIFVMSDHGFSNFGRQFNLNSWLRDLGYLGPTDCTSILQNCDWTQTVAYGLGINGLYLNLKGRERDGIVEPGEEREALLTELTQMLEDAQDFNGQRVIRKVYRDDEYRASWATCLGDLTEEVLLDNDAAWSADHCCDAAEVPGLLCCNRPLAHGNPTLVDIAPSILDRFGLKTPATMTGRSLFQT
ncbi:MAG: hypothetical protein B7Z55_03160 [Planctomycetales bacterium 12-60-4]|nr:MAG: hypothetical protein B7Z55_03160 [Planctomycetales bacterium 12-60-4]